MQEISLDLVVLRKGAEDFRYLLGRSYPRKNSLDLVGNRYGLRKDLKDLLHRGVFSPEEAAARKGKLRNIEDVHSATVAVDGHNVLITVESALRGQPLIMADDGLIRDISGVSSTYQMTDITDPAIDLILGVLREYKPKGISFFFDAPISKSGTLARRVSDRLRSNQLEGEAQAVNVPEKSLLGDYDIIATSDSALIDRARSVVDLAGYVAQNRIPCPKLFEL